MSIPIMRGMVGKEVGSGLALALFEARVLLVDDVDAALAPDDLAVRGAAFDGGANFHDFDSGNGIKNGPA
jgi:hypothetical protein